MAIGDAPVAQGGGLTSGQSDVLDKMTLNGNKIDFAGGARFNVDGEDASGVVQVFSGDGTKGVQIAASNGGTAQFDRGSGADVDNQTFVTGVKMDNASYLKFGKPPFLLDDQAIYFGNSLDSFLQYSSALGRMIWSGDHAGHVRAYKVPLSQLQAVSSTTHTATLFVKPENEGIQWISMMHVGGASYAGTGITGIYVELGESADPDSLYLQRDMTTAGTLEDDSGNHGADFKLGAEMGDKYNGSNGGDASVYGGESKTIVAKFTATGGGNLDALTAGGDLVVLIQINNYAAEGAKAAT